VAFALFIVGIIRHRDAPFLAQIHSEFAPAFAVAHLAPRCSCPLGATRFKNLLQTSILSGLGVDPANVYQQFNSSAHHQTRPGHAIVWWNVMSQLHNFTTDLIISAVLWLVGPVRFTDDVWLFA